MEPLNQNSLLQREINVLLEGRTGLSVLEAGCGSKSHIYINNISHFAGIDISEKQLGRNPSIHEKILGDIQKTPLGEERYDVIVSWDVLEHLKLPDKALENLFKALKRGGILILAAPVCCSLKGIVTKFLPHFLHVFFYRYIIRDNNAGKEDYGPFKTYLHFGMWPSTIIKEAKNKGLKVAYFSQYEGPVSQHLRSRYKMFDILIKAIGAASRFFSCGRFDATESDYILVLVKER